MTRLVGLLIFGVVLLVLFAGVASASATTRYVAETGSDGTGGSNDCTAEALPCRTIGHALKKAATGDTVSVASGTYEESDTVTAATPVTIVGQGVGTVLEPSSGSGEPILKAESNLSLQNLRLVSGDEEAVVEVVAAAAHLTLSKVVAEQAAPTKKPAIYLAGPNELLTVEGSTISGQEFASISAGQHAVVEVVGSTVSDATGGKGAILVEEGTLGVEGSTVLGSVGIIATATEATLVRDTIQADGVGVFEGGASVLTMRDSEVVPEPGGTLPVAVFLKPEGDQSTTIVGSTLYATAANEPVALEAYPGNGGAVHVSVANSIVATGSNPGAIDIFNEGAPGTWSISHTEFAIRGGAGVPPAGSGTNVDGPPVFANQGAGDYRLTGVDAALLDAGDPSLVLPGETDLAGQARVVESGCTGVAAPDLGAYEFVRTAPCPPPSGGGGGGGAGAGTGGGSGSGGSTGGSTGGAPKGGGKSPGGGKKSAPKITGLSVKESKAGPTLKFSLSEAATVKIAVDRAVTRNVRGHRKTVYKAVGSVTFKAKKPGAQKVTLPARFGSAKLAPGHYGVVVSAVAGGVHSPDRTARFVVTAPLR